MAAAAASDNTVLASPAAPQPLYTTASLYVGDLDPDITEAQLYEKFVTCGPVVLVKVCRDKITRQSLGYAYVNFNQPADAERALDTLNFELLNNRPMRIMWCNRDPALRRSGLGNVFIKNLDKSIDNKALYDTFSIFGNIISCKIMGDDTGGSKGYGFVHYETQEAAEKAIKEVNNKELNGRIVYVGKFLSKHDRAGTGNEQAVKKFTNVYVKNLTDTVDDKKLQEMFAKFGEITSAKVSQDKDGKPLCFGFVNFKNSDDAAKAVAEMNDQVVGEKKLYVSRFQKKNERIVDLKKRYEEKKTEHLKKYYGINLFVKNLDDKIDDERLKKEFAAFGNITSSKVMVENGRSKGFGFVCFSAPEEAARAVAEMNGRIVGAKPLYVALAQRKEDRRKILASQFRDRVLSATQFTQQYQVANQVNPYYGANNNPAVANNYAGNQAAFQTGRYGQSAVNPYQNYQATNTRVAVPRWQQPNVNNAYAQQQQQQQQYYQQQVPQYAGQQNQPRQQYIRHQYQPQQKQGVNPGAAGARYANPQFAQPDQNNNFAQFNKQNKFKPVQNQKPKAVVSAAQQESSWVQELLAAQPQQQKQILGERLFPRISKYSPEYAGKITGMLLEIDNGELLHMLDSEDSLKAKVDEALNVLKAHQEKMTQQQVQQQA